MVLEPSPIPTVPSPGAVNPSQPDIASRDLLPRILQSAFTEDATEYHNLLTQLSADSDGPGSLRVGSNAMQELGETPVRLRLSRNHKRVSKLFSALSKHCSMIHPKRHQHLLNLIFSFSYDTPMYLINSWCSLLVGLCMNHAYLTPVFTALIGAFTNESLLKRLEEEELLAANPNVEFDGLTSMSEGKEPLPPIAQIHDRVHQAMNQILTEIPLANTELFRVLISHYPHKRIKMTALSVYVKNMLQISEYAKSLRDRILTAIVERLLQIDVEINCSTEAARALFSQLEEQIFLERKRRATGQESTPEGSDQNAQHLLNSLITESESEESSGESDYDDSDSDSSDSEANGKKKKKKKQKALGSEALDTSSSMMGTKLDTLMRLMLNYLSLVGTLLNQPQRFEEMSLQRRASMSVIERQQQSYEDSEKLELKPLSTAPVVPFTGDDEDDEHDKLSPPPLVKSESDDALETVLRCCLKAEPNTDTTNRPTLTTSMSYDDAAVDIKSLPSLKTKDDLDPVEDDPSFPVEVFLREQNKDKSLSATSQLADEIFASLLRVFHRTVLRAHDSHFVQFLIFYHCQFKFHYAEILLRLLMEKVLSPQAHMQERTTAALYIASFVSRAGYLRQVSATSTLQLLLQFAVNYAMTYKPSSDSALIVNQASPLPVPSPRPSIASRVPTSGNAASARSSLPLSDNDPTSMTPARSPTSAAAAFGLTRQFSATPAPPTVSSASALFSAPSRVASSPTAKRPTSQLPSVSVEEASKNVLFYAVCEAIFYVFIKRQDLLQGFLPQPINSDGTLPSSSPDGSPRFDRASDVAAPSESSPLLGSVQSPGLAPVPLLIPTPSTSGLSTLVGESSTVSSPVHGATFSNAPVTSPSLRPMNPQNNLSALPLELDDAAMPMLEDSQEAKSNSLKPEPFRRFKSHSRSDLPVNESTQSSMNTINPNPISSVPKDDPLLFGALIRSPLNPLLYCSPVLVRRFVRLATELRLVGSIAQERLIQNADLQGTDDFTRFKREQESRQKSNSKGKSGANNRRVSSSITLSAPSAISKLFRSLSGATDRNISNAFLPFDPFFLPTTCSFFSNIYIPDDYDLNPDDDEAFIREATKRRTSTFEGMSPLDPFSQDFRVSEHKSDRSDGQLTGSESSTSASSSSALPSVPMGEEKALASAVASTNVESTTQDSNSILSAATLESRRLDHDVQENLMEVDVKPLAKVPLNVVRATDSHSRVKESEDSSASTESKGQATQGKSKKKASNASTKEVEQPKSTPETGNSGPKSAAKSRAEQSAPLTRRIDEVASKQELSDSSSSDDEDDQASPRSAGVVPWICEPANISSSSSVMQSASNGISSFRARRSHINALDTDSSDSEEEETSLSSMGRINSAKPSLGVDSKLTTMEKVMSKDQSTETKAINHNIQLLSIVPTRPPTTMDDLGDEDSEGHHEGHHSSLLLRANVPQLLGVPRPHSATTACSSVDKQKARDLLFIVPKQDVKRVKMNE